MTFDWEVLAKTGYEKIEISYSGNDDEGSINEIRADPYREGVGISHELERALEDAAYDVLESHYAGWEINEGSVGSIELDIVNRKATIHHGWHSTQTTYEEKELA